MDGSQREIHQKNSRHLQEGNYDRRLGALRPERRRINPQLGMASIRYNAILRHYHNLNCNTLERNRKFEPLVHKLGRLKRIVKDMGELMNAVIKYSESDKTKDADSENDKAVQNKKNGGKGSQSEPIEQTAT